MFSFLTAFLCSVLFCSIWSSVAEAKLFANCTFGEVKSSEDNNNTSARMITISGQLPSSRGSSSHSCVVTTDNLNSVSYLRAKRNKESKKELARFLLQPIARQVSVGSMAHYTLTAAIVGGDNTGG